MPCSKTPDGLIPKPIKSTLSAHQNAAANAESLQKHWDTRSGYLNTEPCTQAGFKNGLSQSQIQFLVQIPCGLKPELPHSSKLKTLKSNNQELWRSQRAPSRAFCVRNFFSPSADMWLLKGLCTWVFLELKDCRLGAFQSWGVGFRASAFGGTSVFGLQVRAALDSKPRSLGASTSQMLGNFLPRGQTIPQDEVKPWTRIYAQQIISKHEVAAKTLKVLWFRLCRCFR